MWDLSFTTRDQTHIPCIGSEVKVTQSCPTLCGPVDCIVLNSPGQNTGVRSHSLLQGIEPWSPALQVDSLPAEPQGKPKNTGVGSLSADLPDPGIEPGSSALQADSLQTELSGKPPI